MWQVGLRTLFLLMTAAAVWIVYFTNRRAIRDYDERIAAMRPVARELEVEDGGQIAVVKLEAYWYDENRWDIYLPPGDFRLCLATREIDGTVPAAVASSAPLSPGRHTIALEHEPTADGWQVTIECDGRQLLSADEPKAWYPAVGSSGGGHFDRAEQFDPQQPVVLFRRRFAQPGPGRTSTTPLGPADGIMLWIEPAANEPDGA
jgi:hypothetical protein